jgi:hypothetical protein
MPNNSEIVIDVAQRLQSGELEQIGAIDYIVETYKVSKDKARELVFLAESEE